MKLLSILFLLSSLQACNGIRPVIGTGGIGFVEKESNREKDEQQDARISENERRISILERLLDAQESALDMLYGNVFDVENHIEFLETVLNSLISEIDALQDAIDIDLADVETRLATLELELSLLEQGNIAELIDPCGDGPGFDEIIIKLGSGEFIAYFQQGNRRHLSVLENGNYQTTDQQQCNFSVTNGILSW